MRNSAVTGGGFRLWSPRATLRAAALMAMVLGAAIAAGVMPGTAQAQVPPARALFLNLDTVFTQSAVGKDIRGQLEAMLSEIAAREEKVIKDLDARQEVLTGQAQTRPQAEVRKDWDALQAERQGQMSLFQLERTAVQAAASDARRKVNGVLNEIMREVLRERGANMVLSVDAVLVGGVDYDITNEVVARLDKQLPKLKVERPKSPK
ncbi:OmpH family outer membrane protein [Pyruvatibacter mobilis]|uniref:OmpH family outer membrane protein n=1 Tax=Pyruvatibacter mobilis TaxID=1712261 RepID=UPI003BAB54A2